MELSAQVLEGLEEQTFPQAAQYSDVFNDTSVHWFPVQKLKQLPTDTWAPREAPDYRDCEDLEIIRSQAGASAAGPRPSEVLVEAAMEGLQDSCPPSASSRENRKPSAGSRGERR